MGVLSQIKVGKINYDQLARDIGAPSKGAAQVRWSRFQSKLKKSTGMSPTKAKPAGVQKAVKSPAKITNGVKGKEAKKRMSEDGEDEGNGDEVVEPSTPVRKLPGRKARVASFKDMESSEDEEFDEAENGGELMEEAGDGEETEEDQFGSA